MKRKKKKPVLVIRRSGFYVNIIPNVDDVMTNWMENNLTRTDPDGRIRKDGSIEERPLASSMRKCCVTFTPATVAEAKMAPPFDPSMVKRYGLVAD